MRRRRAVVRTIPWQLDSMPRSTSMLLWMQLCSRRHRPRRPRLIKPHLRTQQRHPRPPLIALRPVAVVVPGRQLLPLLVRRRRQLRHPELRVRSRGRQRRYVAAAVVVLGRGRELDVVIWGVGRVGGWGLGLRASASGVRPDEPA